MIGAKNIINKSTNFLSELHFYETKVEPVELVQFMYGTSLPCNLPEFFRDKNPFINKKAAVFDDCE